MQPTPETNVFMSLIPLVIMGLALGIVGHFLAKDKGRPVLRWTVLCVIPFINIFCLMYLIGSTNLRIEAKLDAILKGQGQKADYR
jgi:hypothetical protein